MKLEEKLEKLEGIILELESGDVPLDDAITKYTEAMKLVKECNAKLKDTQEKISKLIDDEGNLSDLEV